MLDGTTPITPVTNGVNGHVNGVNGHANGINDSTPALKMEDRAEKSIPVAICGMALRLPGGTASPEEFWDFLINKGDARSRVPESRYNVSAYYRPDKKPGAIATEYGYFLDESVKLGAFDSTRFSLSRAELEFADPQQRRLLEVVREALDDAGDVSFRGKPIGCYVGNMGEDWGEMMNRDPQSHGANRIDGYNDWMLGNRISYEFGFTGPSMTIRTACSSALIGLNEACAAMQRGVCEGAVIAGSTLIMAPGTTQSMTEKGILGPDGSCKTFSADANGYARGEAITAIYVKPLDAAIRDGNPIRAVIRAAMSNSDGTTVGITNPNPDAHEYMIRKAYKLAGIDDFSQTAYFECHGTGTAVGDPIETGAVANIFGDHGIHITSVKPNVGHTEGASGIVSLIKAVKSLENRTIPPNIKFNKPNPRIPFVERKLTVPVEPTPFPADKHERVSVNSFGLGGSNAHVIVDSAASFNLPQPDRSRRIEGAPQLLLFSAGSAPSLKRMASGYEEWLEKRPDMADKLDDLAYTLANRREHLTHRAFKVVGGNEIPASAGKKAPKQAQSLVMVFTGQGAQWPRMGRELLLRDDLPFQTTIRQLDEYLKAIPQPPKWTIEQELNKSAKTSSVAKAEFSQPLCTAVQIGLVDLFASIGIEPAAVVGHSSGELAAAYAAGALTAKEAIVGAYQRGQAANLQKKKGAMAAVGLGWSDVEKFLDAPKVVVACENSPKSVTLSGDAEAVQECVARIKEEFPDITARLLKVEKAYHSYHMREIGDEYCASIAPYLEGRQAVKPFFSSVTGTGVPEERVLDAKYWQQNLASPVLFSPAVAGILKHIKNPAFMEVGPHGALAGPARQIFAQAGASPPYLSSMARNEDCVESYLKAIGGLFELNLPVDFKALTPEGVCLPALPRYPWNHDAEELWYESRMSKEWRFAQFPKHPLLGRRQLETTSLEPSFRNILNLDDAPWLRDHCIDGTMVFPAAGYLSIIGEAIRQLSGAENAYSVRHMVLKQALVLSEGNEAEIVTNLRPQRLTDTQTSDWWEFSIASFNGSGWVKHCDGQVAAASSQPAQANASGPLPRPLTTKKVYDVLTKAGMQYGPQFQRLDDITAGTLERTAWSKLNKNLNGDEKAFHLHPAVIDAALQAGLIAVNHGKIDTTNCRAMPTLLEKVTIYRTAAEADLIVTADTKVRTNSDEIAGHFECIADGKVVMDIQGAFTRLEADSKPSEHHLPITSRVEWRQHLDFIDPATLIKPAFCRSQWTPLLEDLAQLCIIFFQRYIESAATLSDNPAIHKFVAWNGRQAERLGKDHPYTKLSDEEIVNKAHALGEQMEGSPVAAAADSMLTMGGNVADVLSGAKMAASLLEEDGLINKLHASINAADVSDFVQSVAHLKNNLRVLQLGARSGDVTEATLKSLTLPMGKPIYSKYTFSDPSSNPFADAKKRFQDVQNIEFKVLDISKDLAEQNFDNVEYDLVIATNALHTTGKIAESLKNVRKLLAPGGRLLLQEIHSESKWLNCALGFTEEWWVGYEDGRTDEPYVAPARWESELKAAGFAGVDAIVLDSEEPHQLNAIIVASKEVADTKTVNQTVTLLAGEESKSTAALTRELQSKGYTVERFQLGDELPKSQDVISLLDESGPFFENVSEASFKALQQVLANLGETGLFWITRPSQMHCNDPRYSQVIGAARSIRNEDLLNFTTCEVESVEKETSTIVDVFAHFQKRQEDDTFRPDNEYAISNGTVHLPRIYPFVLTEETIAGSAVGNRMSLVAEKPGRVSSLRWVPSAFTQLNADEVEVESFAAGVSNKDFQEIMGAVPYPEKGLGSDASGIVSRIGSNVRNVAVGDRVMCLGAGNATTHAIANAALCQKIPESLSFEDAATLPISFTTAIAALCNVGNLQAGQSVLIHNAGSDVGQAAIQVAKVNEAEIFATAANESDCEYLVKNFGLSASRIFSMRSIVFAEDIMRETSGQGVDLVLNSLAGDRLHASWSCVAEFGKMIEIGTQDHIGAGKLELKAFTGSRSYSSVHLDALLAKRPAVVKNLLQSTAQLLKEGKIAPIVSISFDATNVGEAIKSMQESEPLGKVVLSLRNAEGAPKISATALKAADKFKMDPTASYLLAGGLGGIATVMARHMVENGARRLVCLSRNPGSKPEDAAIIKELESMGCEVVLVKGNLTNKDDIVRAVQEASNLKGIIHSPMLLFDESFRNMTVEQWNKGSDPKVKGAWYLHEALEKCGIELDFFVFLSSMSGLNGQPGQANYAAANTFLSSFAQYRNNLGRAASSIEIGAVSDMGYAARDDALLQRLIANGYSGVTESEMIEATAAAMTFSTIKSSELSAGQPYVHQNTFATGFGSKVSLSSPDSRSWWKKDPRMGVWHNISKGSADEESGGNTLKAFIASAKAEPETLRKPETINYLATEIGKQLMNLLLKSEDDVDVTVPVSQLGLDSLVGIEMRNWWRQTFAADISVLQLLGLGTLEGLGKQAADQLVKATEA